jgi:hypothetical protein
MIFRAIFFPIDPHIWENPFLIFSARKRSGNLDPPRLAQASPK